MKGNQPRILPSVFQDRYQIIVGAEQPLASANEWRLSCPVYAEQFLRRSLKCTAEYWRRLVSQYFSGYSLSNDDGLYSFVAQQCVLKKIRVYQLPSLKHSPAFAHNGLGTGYRFVNAGPADMFHNADPLPLRNDADIEKLLTSLRITTSGFWTQVLKENNALPSDPRVDHRSHVKHLITSGKLAVFKTAYTPKLPAPESSSSSSSSQPATQADKTAPLAPESDTDSSPAEQESDATQSETSSQEEAQAKQGETDEVSQTQTMQDAAEAGAAFCEECEK